MREKYIPNVETVTMYARIDNISHKNDEDLRHLCKVGVNDLNTRLDEDIKTGKFHPATEKEHLEEGRQYFGLTECKKYCNINISF